MEKEDRMEKWMSMKQVCAYLSISRDTAIKWIIKECPHIRLIVYDDLIKKK